MVYGDISFVVGWFFVLIFFESIVYIPTEAKEFIETEKLPLVGIFLPSLCFS